VPRRASSLSKQEAQLEEEQLSSPCRVSYSDWPVNHSEPRSMRYEKAQLDLPLADSARPLNLGCAMMQTTTHDSLYRSFQFRAWAGYLEDGTDSTRPFTSATIRFIALSNFSA
jgi:hypothetical protein